MVDQTAAGIPFQVVVPIKEKDKSMQFWNVQMVDDYNLHCMQF